jgi:quercetin dioxygenase-like cupin family protein/alkylhydroperoxidase/carboxymuconolactone decarboxylase family protein YurZ
MHTRQPKNFVLIAFAFLLMSIPGSMSAQDRASENPALSPERQSIVSIAALTARGDLEELEGVLNSGLDAGLTVSEIKEVLVHLYAYCGFPRTLRGLNTFMVVLDERTAQGISDEIGEGASPQMEGVDQYAKGERVLARLAGWPQDAPQSGYAAFSPVIERFLKEHLFADLFGRDVLSYADREIVTISALTSMEGVEPMLESHMGLGLRVGLTEAQLRQLLSVIASTVGAERAEAGREVLSGVLASHTEPEEGTTNSAQAGSREADEGDSPLQARDTIFPKGTRVTSDNFTGPVWVEMVVTEAETFDARAGNVTFEPGSRTNWHAHPGGQILLVTGGAGYHQVRGESVELVRKGDVVKIPPGVEHWHGATPERTMTHMAVVTQDAAGGTVWMEPVTDDEYHSTW